MPPCQHLEPGLVPGTQHNYRAGGETGRISSWFLFTLKPTVIHVKENVIHSMSIIISQYRGLRRNFK